MDNDEKIKKFPSARRTFLPKNEKSAIVEIKNFLGFEYVKLEKDANKIAFNEKQLSEYQKNIKYTISVARTQNNKTYLYEYFVEGSRLTEFFKLHIDGKISGEIIQLDKFTSENLA